MIEDKGKIIINKKIYEEAKKRGIDVDKDISDGKIIIGGKDD